MIKGLTAAFHKKYPQVSFTLQETGFSQFIKSMKLLMSSDSAPDLVEYHPAQGLVKGSLITDLAPYEQAYGWDSSFPKSALDMLRVSKDGKKLGEGILTSIPAALSVVGVFYNKKMLKDAGVDSTPTTLADLEADFAKVKTAGMTPLTVGALDYGGLRLWGELLNVMTDHTKLTEWIDGKAGSDITAIQGVLDATDKMGQYVAKGYFPKSSSLGLSEADAATKFAQGSSVFLIDGNWAAAQLSTAMKDNVGFFLLPPVTAGEPAVANGSSISYAISSKSQHQVAAAAFLNFLGSAEAAKIEAIKGGFLPPNAAAAPKQSGVMGDLEVANTQIVKSNGLVPYPNDAAPAMIDSMVSGMQKLIADRMTGKDYIDSLQKVWTDYHGS